MKYKVMLVDDDYPVLEFLSEMIEWDLLGLELQSTHGNGASALAYATIEEMPDILITDIGMPKMDGLELTEKMRQKKPDIQVAILSCHSEFKYAQKAMKLGVQDYLLKETLDPEDLSRLLIDLKQKVESNHKKNIQQDKLQHAVERNKHVAKEKFIRELIHQSQYSSKEWLYNDNYTGFKLDDTVFIPILCFIEDYNSKKSIYVSEDLFLFSVQNIIGEVLADSHIKVNYFHYEMNKSFILFPYRSTLKMDSFEKAINMLSNVQNALKKYLNVTMSFLLGNKIAPEFLQSELISLIDSKTQIFYMDPGLVEKKSEIIYHANDDLFSYYDEAAMELRELVFKKQFHHIEPFVGKWLEFIKERNYQPKIVKEWILKLFLELKVKLKAIQHFQSSFDVDILQLEIIYIETINDLRHWIINCLESVLELTTEALYSSKHKEILEACVYVTMNIEKKLSLDEVANHLYLNSSYFSRLFKKEVGKTFVEYVKTMKMERAKELLDQTADTVGEISERLGYDNQSYFIKLFRNYVGITPAEFRVNKHRYAN